MENRQPEVTEGQQSRAYIAWYGLQVGLCWVASFALAMWGLTTPLAGNFALLVGIASVPLAVWLLRDFNRKISPLTLRRAWHMAWMMMICAAIITTAAQYIYFAYMDDGLLVRAYSEMCQQPEMQVMLQQMFGADADKMVDEALTIMGATSASQMSLQLMMWNVLLGTVLAIPVMLFGRK